MKWSVAANPWGLSINTSYNVLVTCRGAHRIQEYTPGGSLLREVVINNSSPYHAIQLSDDQFLVSCCGSLHRVCVVGLNGEVIRSYGNQAGSGTGQLNNPFCLAMDKEGNVLVADCSNNRIMALNSSLSEARQLSLTIDGCIQNPLSIYLDTSSGRLYIGENSGQCRVAVFEHVFNIDSIFRQ